MANAPSTQYRNAAYGNQHFTRQLFGQCNVQFRLDFSGLPASLKNRRNGIIRDFIHLALPQYGIDSAIFEWLDGNKPVQ